MDLPTWERPYYKPGGGDAFAFYAVFGDFADAELKASREVYRVRGIPDGITTTRHDRARPDQAAWFTGFLTGPLGHLLDEESGDTDLAAAVRAAPDCLVITGTVADPPTLDYLRDGIGLVTCALDAGGVGVLDAAGLRWWSPESWRRDIFAPEAPDLLKHADILVSEDATEARDERTLWLHTRGMRKFGRPDLSVRGVRQPYLDAVIGLCNRFILLQALGDIVPENQPVRLPGLPEGMFCRHAGSFDDPDFNNVHLRVHWPQDKHTNQGTQP